MNEKSDDPFGLTIKEVKNTSENVKKAVRWIGATAAASLVVAGGYLMFRNSNMDDFLDLRDFTSSEHQDDRCETQAAFDAQVKIREHFDKRGGLTDEEANAMAPVVGLEPIEMKSLVDAELFPMDYDCEVATASSQEATMGLAAATFGTGLLIGAVVQGVTKRRQ